MERMQECVCNLETTHTHTCYYSSCCFECVCGFIGSSGLVMFVIVERNAVLRFIDI